MSKTAREQRIADAVRRTLVEHATCIEDAGDAPLVEWECDSLVLARTLEAARTAPGARDEGEGADGIATT